tara:strand:+ start:2312 stop:2476 length:165 start_codon:yes stop_codon:yes gene_type:complete
MYEYKVFTVEDVKDISRESVRKLVEDLSRKGWEVVHADYDNMAVLAKKTKMLND